MSSPVQPSQHHAHAHALQCMELWGGTGLVDRAASVPGMDVRVHSTPYASGTTGGDLHYVTTCGAQNITRFVLADVSGHGEAVSRFGGLLRRAVRRAINTVDQSSILRALNTQMLSDEAGGRFATAILATYYAPTDHLVVSNAGHPPPLWYRAGSREWVFLEPDATPPASIDASALRDLPLGVIGETGYTQFAVRLEPNDLVVMYTDAAIEATSPEGEMLGSDGLLSLAQELDTERPETLVEQMIAALARHTGGGPADDDTTFMVLHHNAGTPPQQSLGEKLQAVGRMLGIGRIESLSAVPA